MRTAQRAALPRTPQPAPTGAGIQLNPRGDLILGGVAQIPKPDTRTPGVGGDGVRAAKPMGVKFDTIYHTMMGQKLYASQKDVMLLANLEQEARGYSHVIITAGAEIDPIIFSNFMSRFLHIAGKLRRLRIRFGVRGG